MRGRVFTFKGRECKPIEIGRGAVLKRTGKPGVVLGSQLYATMPTFRLRRLHRLGVDPDLQPDALIARLRNVLTVAHWERSVKPATWTPERYQMAMQALRGEQLLRDRDRIRGAMPWRPDLWQ